MWLSLRAAAAAACTIVLASGISRADARHKLRDIRQDAVDLVVNVGWDFDNPSNGGTRAHLEDALHAFAERTYQMTQGRLRVCKLYVYKQARDADQADIDIADQGRAHATPGGIAGNGQIQAYLRAFSTNYEPDALGAVLAHEFGHYGLFLYDEYAELAEAGVPQPGPRRCDVTFGGMMGLRDTLHLSTPASYRDEIYPAWQLPANAGDLSKQEKYSDCTQLTPPAPNAPPSEDATWRTDQWRKHRLSAWEVITGVVRREPLPRRPNPQPEVRLFSSIVDGGVPDVLTEPAWDGACFKVHFMKGHFAVLVIDNSASMDKDSPVLDSGGKPLKWLDLAKLAAKQYVSGAAPGTVVALFTFASTAQKILDPLEIPEQNPDGTRAQINAAIDAVAASPGDTGLDGALAAARDLAITHADRGNIQYIIAISDGQVVASDWLPRQLSSLAMPVFTVAVASDPNEAELAKVARISSGAHRQQAGWLYDDIVRRLEKPRTIAIRTYPKPPSNALIEEPVEVSELERSTAIDGYWSPGEKVGFELVSPGGKLITPSQLPAGVSYEQTNVGGSFSLTQPEVGTWKVRLVPQAAPSGDLFLNVASDTPLRLRVEAQGSGQYPEPWFVYASLEAPRPVVGASVKGSLKAEDAAASTDVAFTDDGLAPDLIADDGVYTAVIADVTADGKYALDVSATNPGGARVESFAVADAPGDAEPPIPLSGFRRDSSLQLEAKGFHPMPQTVAQAVHVRNDLTPVWVTINQPGDVVWLEFNGYAKGRYVAMTGNLVSNDGAPMATRLSLYEGDGVTLIASDAAEDGRARVELRTGNVDAVYYLKAEHAGGGIGRFRVAVAPAEWLEGAAENDQDDAASACGCRAPGSRGVRYFALGVLACVLTVFGLRGLRGPRRRSR